VNFPHHPAALAALGLPARLYGALVRRRNLHYDRPGATRGVALPVISVGNLTVGGTGKTPLVAWLVRWLLDQGRSPAVVSRGYGGKARRGPLVVSRGDGPLCPARRCGDEPWLLAASLPGARVVVGSDRVAGAEAAQREGADCVVLDDGFQHRRLARDLDLLLLAADDPFGNGRLLPAGPLREPVEGLARADVVLATGCGPAQDLAPIERAVRLHNPAAPVLAAGHRAVGFFDPRGDEHARPQRAVAFCGIGNPERFRADLLARGVEVVEFRTFRDHHRFSSGELGDLRRRSEHRQARLVTTEKDLARIGGTPPGQAEPILALRIEAEVVDPTPLLSRVVAAVERASQ